MEKRDFSFVSRKSNFQISDNRKATKHVVKAENHVTWGWTVSNNLVTYKTWAEELIFTTVTEWECKEHASLNHKPNSSVVKQESAVHIVSIARIVRADNRMRSKYNLEWFVSKSATMAQTVSEKYKLGQNHD